VIVAHIIKTKKSVLQVQCSFSTKDTGMGFQVNVDNGNNWELVDCSESLDLFGGCVCCWRYRQTTSAGYGLRTIL